jgi:hypothetical protein
VVPIVLEKDFWVCWTLMSLANLEGVAPLTFKGGTSLSKVHRLIDRFSEDIDLTFSRDDWDIPDPLEPNISKNERKRRFKKIIEKGELETGRVKQALEAAWADSLPAETWEIRLSSTDSQSLEFVYPPGVEHGAGYMAASVLLEFGARGDPSPAQPRRIESMLDEVVPEYGAGIEVAFNTLEPERTFWEKATAIHSLQKQFEQKERGVGRMSRHLYDLHFMWADTSLRETLRASEDLYSKVVAHKTVFFAAAAARYDLAANCELAVLPEGNFATALEQDYEDMNEMFLGEPPPFKVLLASMSAIRDTVTGW